ncbi:homoserine O-acetyltransferase [Algoriphagus ratkowskyi]|uniref:Homoserine O-acetyltransferase n=1 Tax=Algoriphagus ratkowskyi TaxID=57028 RepID=A0A2W7RMZ4_9BACT|nr:homoserine O-acetyltransferase [Algoriphagus ratkowskyi]PZX56887.1 homoserine O-acetyltransferase [Algoriphagus ratkowskyi]TXD79801.1 homoserine O-acetyltransferase [Algoriphagus ratkowskyi]
MNLKSQYASITMTQDIFHSSLPLHLESGEILPEFDLGYTTYGQLNADKSNVIWVIHALTGDSNAQEWWNGLIGEDKFFDPSNHFIICANLLGSCYGSTQPFSENPITGKPYYYKFPQMTTRDLAQGLERLRIHLKIEYIHSLIGGSLGGQVGLEWAYLLENKLKNAIILASTAKTKPWVIGFNETQRMAIESDCTWGEFHERAGQKGLETARAIAMLTYRHPLDLETKQSDQSNKLDDFRAASYLRYQGQKLAKRFNALSYWTLSKTMDCHDLGRNRGGSEEALSKILANVLAIGVNSDLLFLPSESQFISQHVSRGTYKEISSNAGHDAFLIEFEQLSYILKSFYLQQKN